MKIDKVLILGLSCLTLFACNNQTPSTSTQGSNPPSSIVPDKVIPTELKIMSCNLDQGATGDQAKYKLVSDQIKLVMPDIFGVQEETEGWENYLRGEFEEYGYDHIVTYRGGAFNEASGIFYSIDRFELVESGAFWLGQDPNAGPGYVASEWGAQYPRVCTFAVLKDLRNDTIFSYFNTHFEHTKGVSARKKSAEQILNKIEALNMPAILTGDLNFFKENEQDTYDVLSAKMDDAYSVYDGETCTFHNYGGELDPATRENPFAPIDYIWTTKGHYKAKSFDVLTQEEAPFYSDHFFVTATIDYITE